LVGGAGVDRLYGGQGDDTYVVSSDLDQIVEIQGEGVDTVHSTVSLRLADNVENLKLLGDENLSGRGNAGDNVLIGNDGANDLRGGGGDDFIFGGAGDDMLAGDAGINVLEGGVGDDLINLRGGQDTVIFNAGDGFDRLYNFEHEADKVDLSSFGFSGFEDIADKVVDAGMWLQIDLGGGDALRFIGLDPAELTGADFIF
ncbi:MAG: hypothetical protein RIM80_02010, partial [Alphaproteobacteria bacterium]